MRQHCPPSGTPAFTQVSGPSPATEGSEYALEAIRGLRGNPLLHARHRQ